MTQIRTLTSAHFVSLSRLAMACLASGRGGLDLHRRPSAEMRRQAELPAVLAAPEPEEKKEQEQPAEQEQMREEQDSMAKSATAAVAPAFSQSHAATPADLQPAREPASSALLSSWLPQPPTLPVR
jgi:hypothetical protein